MALSPVDFLPEEAEEPTPPWDDLDWVIPKTEHGPHFTGAELMAFNSAAEIAPSGELQLPPYQSGQTPSMHSATDPLAVLEAQRAVAATIPPGQVALAACLGNPNLIGASTQSRCT
eukprot:TRINITY_DN35882_c0_g1_i1.p2 TRINITY_DN35882_c0_g1~~TRINITY_DN35882_c0_g1_i1.p2  ORF type:complete len:116 (-),score=22.26 TRINITY_DN35882_c0_g1_i1:185-532(-)